jgi:KilA-N domain
MLDLNTLIYDIINYELINCNIIQMEIPKEYKSLTEIARLNNSTLSSWMTRKVGKDAIAAFTKSHPDIENPVIIIRGRGKNQGTYAHPALAAIFAVWCNPSLPADHHKLIKMAAEKISQLTSQLPQPAPGITVLQIGGFTIEHDELLGLTNLSAIAKENNADLKEWFKKGYKAAARAVMNETDLDLHQLVWEKEGGDVWAHPLIAITFGQWISSSCGDWCEANLIELTITGANTQLRDPSRPKPQWDKPNLSPATREQMYAERDRLELKEKKAFLRMFPMKTNTPEFAQYIKEQNEIARYFVRNDIKIIPPQSNAQLLELARVDRLALTPAK